MTQKNQSQLIRSELSRLAKVGINALVDEATNYQAHRESNALRKMLEQYVAQDLLNAKGGLPDVYTSELHRLHGITLGSASDTDLAAMTAFTGQYLYGFLLGGIVRERELNDAGAMAERMTSADVSDSQLVDHVVKLETIMKLSGSVTEFERNFNKLFVSHVDHK